MRNCRGIIKSAVFVFMCVGIFIWMQSVFVPKWYYPDTNLPESPTRTVTGFYEEPKNSLDVITFGASTVLYGYSPMYVYEKYGIKSYNLATSAQPTDVSYFAVKEALKYQNPKAIIIDVAPLFSTATDYSRWRYFMDNIPLSINKIQMAYEFSKKYADEGLIGSIFPLLRYHERWEELCERDFTDMFRNRHNCEKGYYLNAGQLSAGTVEGMNEYADLRSEINTREVQGYDNGEYFAQKSDLALYKPEIIDERLGWLLKIKNLCDERGIDLIAVKIPANYFSTGWSMQKYQEAKEIMSQQGIAYYDLMYDIDTGIDWNVDTRDGGSHMNILGAQKVSDAIGAFLAFDYGLSPSQNSEWDSDIADYSIIRDLALLELDNDFQSYLSRLANEYSDKTILIAAQDDFYNNLSDSDIAALKSLGLQTVFEDAFRKSFIAVIENGIVQYEALSNRTLTYKCKARNGADIDILSANWLEGSNAQISVDNVQYALNNRGLNIVVYDDENNMVLDSACFDTSSVEHTGRHSSKSDSIYLNRYKNYIMN